MKDAVIAERMQHAADELRHADMVSNRIIRFSPGRALRSDR